MSMVLMAVKDRALSVTLSYWCVLTPVCSYVLVCSGFLANALSICFLKARKRYESLLYCLVHVHVCQNLTWKGHIT